MPAQAMTGGSERPPEDVENKARDGALYLAIGVAAAGIVLSTALSFWLSSRAEQRAEEWLTTHGEVVAEAISGAVGAATDRLIAVGGLYEASEEVTRAEFSRFIDNIGITPGVGWIAHASIVEGGDLPRFAAEVGETLPGYAVFEFDQDQEMTVVVERPEHMPVQWLEPVSVFGFLRGFDLASEPYLLAALEEARQRREVTATPFVRFPVQGDSDGVVFAWPVVDPATEEVDGFTVGIMDLSDVVEAHLPPALRAELDWSIVDAEGDWPTEAPDGPMVWTRPLEVGGRRWGLTVTPTRDMAARFDGAGSAFALLAGGMASLLAAYVVYQYRQRSRTREEIARLRALNSAKDRFLASVSHELRTPLTGVLGFAELLWDEAESLSESERRTMIGNIAAEAADLAAIIDDLLVAARSELDLVTVTRVPIRARPLVVEMLETSAQVGCDRVRVTGAPDERWNVLGDPARLRQIMRNLISNACRYGGDRVEVRGVSAEGEVRIQVADDGAALPREEWERIFEPYYRAHHIESQPAALGIGLSISRHLARLMGGDLTYRYQNGWSVFELTLPAVAKPVNYLEGSERVSSGTAPSGRL